MVEAIGGNRVAVADAARVAATTTVRAEPATTASPAIDAATSGSITMAKQMAATAPIDTAHVAEIRKAIANGTFPILPATIADQMLAFKLDWTSNDQA